MASDCRMAGEDFLATIHTTSKEMAMRTMLIKLFLVALVAASLVVPTTAGASYQRFLPNGLPTSSPAAAKAAVLDYAELNSGYAQMLASQTGAGAYIRSEYHSAGWGTAPANTKNTALSGTGSAVAYSGAVGVRTIRIRNTRTGVLVHVMVRCGNMRVKRGVRVVSKVKIRRILRIYVNKKFTVTKTVTCQPLGQQVKGTVTGWVRGWFRTRVHGWTTGAKLWYKQQVDLKVTNKLTLKCLKAKLLPPPPSGGNQTQTAEVSCPVNAKKIVDSVGQVTCQIQQLQCSAGFVLDAKGVCVQQTNTAEQNCKVMGGTFNGDTQLCTIIQINANCSNVTILNGSGDVVSTSQEGNCNTIIVPPPVNRPPSVQILNMPQHVFVSGQVQICSLASDPDGDSLTVTWSANRGTVSTAFQPDPIGNPTKWCMRYTAPTTAGSETVSVTVNDGEFSASDGDPIPYGIVADQF